MLTLFISWMLTASVPASTAPARQPPSDDCEDTRRLELSPPVLTPPRLCISPGTLMGVLFDHPVTVELQDEARFTEVIRGRTGIAFVPPRDLRPGETLRMTALVSTEEASQSLTFVLVAHPGHGSHQVEVRYLSRSWQSLTDALSQALLANERLRMENTALVEEGARLRARFALPTGLCGAFDGGQLAKAFGIKSRRPEIPQSSAYAPNASTVTSYRGSSNIAVQVVFMHPPTEQWSLERASLINERGELLESLRHRQAKAPPPNDQLTVFVEFAPGAFTPGQATLLLVGSDGRIVTLNHVTFP